MDRTMRQLSSRVIAGDPQTIGKFAEIPVYLKVVYDHVYVTIEAVITYDRLDPPWYEARRRLLHRAAGHTNMVVLYRSPMKLMAPEYEPVRWDAVVGFLPAPHATGTVSVSMRFHTELTEISDIWSFQITPGSELLPAFREHTIIPRMCYKVLSFTCEPPSNEPVVVYAMLHDFARRALIVLDPFLPFCAEALPDLRLRVPRRLMDRLHKDLIEAVWHPDRVRKGLMSIDSDIDRLLNVS